MIRRKREGKLKYKYYFWNFTLDFAHQPGYKRFYYIDRGGGDDGGGCALIACTLHKFSKCYLYSKAHQRWMMVAAAAAVDWMRTI